MQLEEQKFLNDLDKKLWNAADKLRSNIDAAEYKHVVLGLIFLKYVSDAFVERKLQIEEMLRDENHDYGVLRANYDSDEEYEATIHYELEIRDYYTEKNVFWVPALARWENLQNNAKVAPGTEIEIKNGKKITYKFTSIGKLIDDALEEIEKENPKLKNVLDKNYARRQIDPNILGQLIDKIAEIPFQHKTLHAKDILGHVYEYFLGQFALSEGKKGGQYYTPKAIVTLIVEMLQPYKGRVYDPAMGSGGFFVSSEKFIEEHEGKLGNISVYGQESNPTTWRLAAMNMAIRGIDFNFGGEPANTYSNDKHPDLRADFVMANPPFNMKEWNTGVKDNDPRWHYGIPPPGNANFAWMQHMLYHLAPNGSMGLLLANGSMSSNTNNEGEIRKRLLEEDRVECMVALPGQLFTNTQIPACIWFLTKNKNARDKFRDRSGEVLFIDARNLGYMKDRVLRDFTPEDINNIAGTFHNWKTGEDYEDVAGYCSSASLEQITKHDYVLTPGRYVGAPEEEDDGEPFADKMARLTSQLKEQFEQSDKLEEEIKKNLAGLGYDL
ncbi:MAG: type I restriction-modification system subunit M [Gammaproteobacteria bacterium]|nr:type I restriction-modification system subunit M [Gammaproteobacteria bacterium]